MAKGFRYFEHQADIGIIGEGKTLAKAFEEGAKAMFTIMCNINRVDPEKKVTINVSADDTPTLFIAFLNELLAQKDIRSMMFSKFKVKISGNNLAADAWGETISQKHQLKTEVKAASLSQLDIKRTKDKYIIKCVVDV